MLIEGSFEEVDDKECLVSGCSVTGTIGNFCCGIRHAPPLIHTCIVPEGAACLYALFEWGLTMYMYIFYFYQLLKAAMINRTCKKKTLKFKVFSIFNNSFT